METEDIDYKTLRRIQQLEEKSPMLTKIDKKFYQNLSQYIKNLEKIVAKEKNPQKIQLFKDELQNIKKIADNLYKLREKKIVQTALSKARGGKPDLKNLLEPEKKLFENIFNQIISSRREIFEQKTEEITSTKTESTPMKKNKKQPNKNPIVRVLKDMPEFVGTDMKIYVLKKEDVISLPKDMSDPLIKRNVVKQIK